MKASYLALIVIVVVVVVAGGAYYAYNYTSTTQPTQKQFKVAVIFETPLDEPWNQVMFQALEQAQTKLNINFTEQESVGQSQEPGVAIDFINSGYNLTIPDSWDYWNSTGTLAAEYPNTYFAEGSGLNANFGNNLMLFDSYLQESDYIAGYVAAMVTNTSHIGVVSAYQSAGDVDDELNGFIAGAQAYNPNINITITYINEWYAPADAKSAAQALIASGCDVIFGEREGVFQACTATNGSTIALAIGHYFNETSEAPNVVLGSVVWNIYPMLSNMILGAENHNFTTGAYFNTMKNNDTYFAWTPSFEAQYPAAYATSQQLVQKLEANEIFWGGTVTLYNGTVVSGADIPISVPNFNTPNP
jgi:basic membrane lipoprotein Med (substrate-binding protein (PBP1-ABC) superfamily)